MNFRIFLLSAATLFIFGFGGILLIEYMQLRDFQEVLWYGWPVHWQLGTGIAAGAVSAGIAMMLIKSDFFKNERQYYYQIISKIGLNVPGILVLSLSAGIGEEIFFRAGLQPLLGIWGTSIIFVFLHGYLNITNYRIFTYGLLMVIIIAGFGYLYRYTGLFTVMSAHAVFDMILLWNIYNKQKHNSSRKEQSREIVFKDEEE
jgi:hypothetical protein